MIGIFELIRVQKPNWGCTQKEFKVMKNKFKKFIKNS